MAAAVAPYIEWMTTTAALCEQTASNARAAAAAYEAAFAMAAPPPMIAANRAQLMALIATNILGQNTPAIAATEAAYGEMWAQDAGAMYEYAARRDPAEALRGVFGPYRGPTGLDGSSAGGNAELLADVRAKVSEVSDQIGHRIRLLVAKPGLDGHSNGAEQIAVRARDVGMEVIYQGIRLTPEEIAASAVQEDVDLIGLSILSGSHRELVPRVVELIRAAGVDVPVIVGGIIPPADARRLAEAGVASVYTPKDFDLNRIMVEIAELVAERSAASQPA